MDMTTVTPIPPATLPTESRRAAQTARSPAEPRTPAAGGQTAPVAQTSLRVSLAVDAESNRVIATITDAVTGQVIAELPPEQLRNIAASIREMLDHALDVSV